VPSLVEAQAHAPDPGSSPPQHAIEYRWPVERVRKSPEDAVEPLPDAILMIGCSWSCPLPRQSERPPRRRTVYSVRIMAPLALHGLPLGSASPRAKELWVTTETRVLC
jgi:hypothetical protein